MTSASQKVVKMASLFCMTVVKADAQQCGLGPEDVFVLEMTGAVQLCPSTSTVASTARSLF